MKAFPVCVAGFELLLPVSDHQHVVAAGGSHFERAFGAGLAADIAEIGKRLFGRIAVAAADDAVGWN